MLAALLAAASVQLPPADHVVPSFWMGVPVLVHAYETRPRVAGMPFKPDPEVMRLSAAAPVYPVYITAPRSAESPHSAERAVTLADGRKVVIPAHQATLSRFMPKGQPAETIAWFVLPGPNADADTVRTAPRAEGSLNEAPLAEAIRIGAEWARLDSHLAVQYGLKTGLLRLQFFDRGSLMWAEFDRPEVSCAGDCSQISSLPPLPEVPEK